MMSVQTMKSAYCVCLTYVWPDLPVLTPIRPPEVTSPIWILGPPAARTCDDTTRISELCVEHLLPSGPRLTGNYSVVQ